MQTVNNIGEKFWYMTPVAETDHPILGMVVGNDMTLLIDAGNSEAHVQYFLNELSEKKIPRPKMVALTHWHWDHIFGLSSLKDAISISSMQTKEQIMKLIPFSWSDEAIDERVKEGTEIEFCATAIKKEFVDHRDITITLPVLTFENRLDIDLGGLTCILQHVGGDHASDSVVIFIKEEKILFLGDCIYADIFSSKTNYTTQGVFALLEILETFNADTYILSHEKAISKVEFNNEVQLLRTIATYTDDFKGDAIRIKEAYEKQVNRELTKDELETIQYFVSGYQMQQI